MGTIKVVKLVLARQMKARPGGWLWEWKKLERGKDHLIEGRFNWIDDNRKGDLKKNEKITVRLLTWEPRKWRYSHT